MTRDEAIELMTSKQPCFYTGEILLSFKGKPLFIHQVTRPTSTLLAALVDTSPNLPSNSAWIKLHELTAAADNHDSHTNIH